MSESPIKNLEQLLGLEIINQKISLLTAPGENYGSIMYAVDVIIKTPEGTEEIAAVAKTVPPNEMLQKIFRTQVTFKTEIYFYETIMPLLQQFQRDNGVAEVIDFGAKFLGGRVSLNKNSDTVDNDAVLLLENLKAKNYSNLDRFQGVDLYAAKLVLKDLAYLHGISIVIKIKKPGVFEKKIKPALALNSPENNTHLNEHSEQLSEATLKALEGVGGCVPYLPRIRKALEKPAYIPSRELFSTISHGDCWVNNVMVKTESGKAVKNKLVDFQMYDYASLARDVVFFLFSSVKCEILEKSYDELVKFYYDTFISVLKELKCDVEKFGFEDFLDEIDYEAKNTQFNHCAWMMIPIFQPKGAVKELSEFRPDEIDHFVITDLHKEKFTFLVKEFAKRNWI